MTLNNILKTTKYVVENAKDVSIDYKVIDDFCTNFTIKEISHWSNLIPVDLKVFSKEQKIIFLLIQDSINFCFWGNPKWEYIYKEKTYTGSIAMVIGLYKAVINNNNLLDGKYLSSLKLNDIKDIYPTDKNLNNIPLIEERLNHLKNIGEGLIKIKNDYNINLDIIIDNMYDEKELFEFIAKYFSTYNQDYVSYKSKIIYLHKRIQLVISDINEIVYLNNKFTLDLLNIFPDYKIPQLMRELGFIKYSKYLSNIVNNKLIIEKNDELETEIRASIVQVGEYMKNKLKIKYPKINAAYLDSYMFVYIKTNKEIITKPYHRVRTTNY